MFRHLGLRLEGFWVFVRWEERSRELSPRLWQFQPEDARVGFVFVKTHR